MRVFNDSIEYSVGVSSIDQGEYIGLAYSGLLPPANGLIIQGFVGIGTTTPTQPLTVQGNALFQSGYTNQGTGVNTNLQVTGQSTFQSSNTVFTAGYTNQGTGINTNIRITGTLTDSSNLVGLAGSVLSSTSTGIAWTAPSVGGGTGNISGTISQNQITFASGTNTLSGISTLVFVNGNVGIGINNPSTLLQVGSALTNNILYIGAGFVGINTSSQSPLGPESLVVRQSYYGTLNTSPSIISGISSVNTFSGINMWNRSGGNNASSDFILIADTGNPYNAYHADFGINNSGYSQSGLYGNALDTYLLSNANTMWIANTTLGSSISFVTGTSIFTLAPLMVLTSGPSPTGLGGSVGIGTTAPTQLLHIQGNARLKGSLYDFNNLPGVQLGIVTQYLSSYNGLGVSWSPIKRNIVTTMLTAYTVLTAGVDSAMFIFPYDPSDGTSNINYNLKRVIERCETGGSALGTTFINLAKYTGSGAFSALSTTILSSNIGINTFGGLYEGFSTSFNTGFATASSGDKFAVNFFGTAFGFNNWTVQLIAKEN